MPRAIWSGAVAFGLVSVPVKLYSATERRAELAFRQLHKKDHAPIDYRRFCSKEDIEVDWKDIARGYEYAKGRFVVLTEGDFERAKTPATQTLEIRDFVPGDQIDFAFFETPYWLEPTRPGRKAYGLLRDALAETGRVGIGTFVMRQREHLAALRPSGKALLLTTMRFADEIRPATQLDLPNGVGATREKKLALQLIDTLASDWEPKKYRDTYREVLRAAIEQKVEGKEIVMPEAPKPPKVVDLMEALQASLKAPRRDLAKAAGRMDRRSATAGRRRKSVRAAKAA
ncbi:MAG TPA: Ku protein [Methylomirabilota bacterium]|nr:Ku protein [Methylomirabilota bacterium]